MRGLKEMSDKTAVRIPEDKLSPEGLGAFLAGPYIKGIGKVYASRIIQLYGLDILKPDFDLGQIATGVPGLSESKIGDIKTTIVSLKFDPLMAILLYSAGLTDVEVEKVLSHYGRKAKEALLEDPYDMVENAWKVSFFTADKLGKWLGVNPEDPGRIRGALLTAVKFYAERGNLYATESQALKTAASLAGVEESLVRPELEALIAEERLVRSDGGIYLPVFYEAEKVSADKIAALVGNNGEVVEDYEIPEQDIYGNKLDENQREAIEAVMKNPFTVITGGPGSGKTTTIRGIISLFEGLGKKVVLAAPTGRAAKRMSDLGGIESKTLHRLLGYRMGKGYLSKKLDADILVIDEASMLEQVMFRHVLDALDAHTRIVLVGDTHQLPSIGAGDVLNNVIESGTVPVIELRHNYRHRQGNGIAAVAAKVKEGLDITHAENDDFKIIFEQSDEKILEKVIWLLGEELPGRYGIEARNVQVVSPQQEGSLGVKELNDTIQAVVNPEGPELKRGHKLFRLGDRVMQTSNSSLHNVYNGETGIITGVDTDNFRLQVTFNDGKYQWYDRGRLRELTLAYATSVHKLQGSETDYMIFILSMSHRLLLYRNLLYTGISRARKLCIIVGEEKAVKTALLNETPSVRNSNFRNHLRRGLLPLRRGR